MTDGILDYFTKGSEPLLRKTPANHHSATFGEIILTYLY